MDNLEKARAAQPADGALRERLQEFIVMWEQRIQDLNARRVAALGDVLQAMHWELVAEEVKGCKRDVLRALAAQTAKGEK